MGKNKSGYDLWLSIGLDIEVVHGLTVIVGGLFGTQYWMEFFGSIIYIQHTSVDYINL